MRSSEHRQLYRTASLSNTRLRRLPKTYQLLGDHEFTSREVVALTRWSEGETVTPDMAEFAVTMKIYMGMLLAAIVADEAEPEIIAKRATRACRIRRVVRSWMKLPPRVRPRVTTRQRRCRHRASRARRASPKRGSPDDGEPDADGGRRGAGR